MGGINVISGVLSGILPKLGSCIFCLNDSAIGGYCPACYADLPFIERSCLLCALPLPSATGTWQEVCVSCQKKPPPIEYAFSALHYCAPVRKLLHALKFQRQVQYARPLGDIWLRALLDNPSRYMDFKADVLLPVPLHPIKLQQRGFNPSYELAKPLQDALKIPLAVTACRRVKNTAPQFSLSFVQRRQNVKNAFEISGRELMGKNVVILDDVITSAATIYELTRALRKNKVNNIAAWSLMRAQRSSL